MRQLRSILFAADLRPTSREIEDRVIHLAHVTEARLSVLHVLEPIPRLAPLPSAIVAGVTGVLHADSSLGSFPVTPERQLVSQKVLDDLAVHFTSHNVELSDCSQVIGPVTDAILQKANAIDADLIMVGAGERFRSERFTVGPVATSVIEHATQPVLAIRPGEPALRFRKILCPVDHSDPSARGLRNAIRLAQMFGGELAVLSVIPEISWWNAAFETGQLQDALHAHDQQWRDEFDQFLARVDFENITFKKEVRFGSPHQQIIATAQDYQADLIVMGATGRSGLVRLLLGSTTRRVLAELPCSLLTVKQNDLFDDSGSAR